MVIHASTCSLAVLPLLPEDIILEIAGYLDVEDVLTLRMTNKRLYDFTSSRYLWHQIAQSLCYRLPLAIPPCRARSNIATHELRTIVRRALSLENNWRSESPKPTKPPRYLDLTSEANSIIMLRLLPGGRLFLLITEDGSLTCRDTQDGYVVGEWNHGGSKIHSIDVDVVDDGQAMILAVSVERDESCRMNGDIYYEHMVHVLRIDVIEHRPTGVLHVDFVHIMASRWDSPWWIVSVEGDIIAAYACEMSTRPLSHFVVWIANWRTATAAVVHLPESVIHLENWPTLQVVGGQVIIHEERLYSPATLIFPVPDTLFLADNSIPLPHVKITPTLIQNGDNLDNAYQTRFSKIWRNDHKRNASRPLSLFAISAFTNLDATRTVSVHTFDPLPNPSLPSSRVATSITKSQVWRHEALVPHTAEGLRFTFCLGRYGTFPIWMEEVGPPEDLPDGSEYFPELKLMGLFTDYKNGGSRHAKQLATPKGVQLHTLQCLDLDDAEGILCGVTSTGVWIIEYA